MLSSSNQMKLTNVFFISICIVLTIAFADILQNPDFELPPSNWPGNSTGRLFSLNENSTIPGWTFSGGIQYATSSAGLSLPRNGHGILVGQDGRINQTFIANGTEIAYAITFTLAMGGDKCTSNASLVISAPDNSAQFSFAQNYGKEPWEVYGYQIGSWGNGESINLVLQSQAVDTDPNTTCWPVVDTLLLTTIESLNQGNGNLLPNGGFELGPAFLDFSKDGVLLDSEPSLTESVLQRWMITGTIKYINSKNYFVSEGKTAVELVSGISAGVQTVASLSQGADYNLEFMLGDTNDSCAGDFTVGVTAGSSAQNFTVHSRGTGSANKYSLVFKGEGPSPTPIGFQSYTTRQREDGVFCGPVIDGVVLHASSGHTSDNRSGFLVFLILIALLKMNELL